MSNPTNSDSDSRPFRVLALYKFVPIPASEINSIQQTIESTLRSNSVTGSILLASEGINGTICYPYSTTTTEKDIQENEKEIEENNDPILSFFHRHEYFSGAHTRISFSPYNTFHRLKVKLKHEIITMGDMATILPNHEDTQIDTHTNDSNDSNDSNRILSPCNLPVGEYVTPQNWNALLLDPQVAVIDTRNDYEINIGSFQNAINPHTSSFKFFPAWLQQFSKEFPYTKYPDEQYDEIHTKYNNENSKEPPHPRKLKAVAMFCTGGVRCEKSTAYALASNLFQNLSTKSTTTIHSAATSTTTNPTDLSSSIPIYHLAGGILAYLQQIPQEQSLFHGECFVFDQRVSVHGNDLQPGVHTSCHACRKPLTPLDLQHKDYVKGVMCHYCANDIRMNERKVKRMQERQKQMEIAEARGAVHIHDPKNVE